jgi:hypothetical protein
MLKYMDMLGYLEMLKYPEILIVDMASYAQKHHHHHSKNLKVST